MIQPQELRIGNIIKDKENQVFKRVEGYCNTEVYDGYYWAGFEKFEGIPLTPEILEKAGFAFNATIGHWVKNWGQNGMEFIKYDSFYNGWAFQLGQHKYKIFYHIHQLQNLYYSLTGEELKIEL